MIGSNRERPLAALPWCMMVGMCCAGFWWNLEFSIALAEVKIFFKLDVGIYDENFIFFSHLSQSHSKRFCDPPVQFIFSSIITVECQIKGTADTKIRFTSTNTKNRKQSEQKPPPYKSNISFSMFFQY